VKKERFDDPKSTVYDIKRLVSRSFDDSEIQRGIANKIRPFSLVSERYELLIKLPSTTLGRPSAFLLGKYEADSSWI
jgi:molecular chaperone DnaK (HSP70)